MKCISKWLWLALFLVFIPQTSQAELGVGLGYPYISLKVIPDFFYYVGLEGKYSTGEGITIYSGRGYINFINRSNLRMYTGWETGMIQFNHENLSGDGKEYGAFLGMEVRLYKALGITLDIAPTIIQVNSQKVGLTEMDWVVNAAVYLYLF